MEQYRRRRNDEYRREGEERLRDTSGGELRGKQRGTHPDEWAENGGGKHTPHRFFVAHGMTELLQAVFVEYHQRHEKADKPDVCADGGGGKRYTHADRQLKNCAVKNGVLRDAESRQCGVIML